MNLISPFLISFFIIFFSELGDKTQILVLSFSSKYKSINVLIGVALGTFLSHGLAILFGSQIGYLKNDQFIFYLKILTYITFLFFGIIGFLQQKKSTFDSNSKADSKFHFINILNSLFNNCIFLVASSIAIGELGDKTFIASIGLGFEYPCYRICLILGSICGMVISNSIAIFFGKWLNSKFSSNMIEYLSNFIFILFGLIGLVGLFI